MSKQSLSAEERRALDSAELELVEQSFAPKISELSDSALSDLTSRLRNRRSRARDLADRQGREARDKAAPAGAKPASGNAGMQHKLTLLTEALDRVSAERDRREGGGSGEMQDNALKAMMLKEEGAEKAASGAPDEGGPVHPDDPRADDGKASLEQTARNVAPSGAFEDVGDLPSRERSRTRY